MRGKVLVVASNFPRWHGDNTTPFVLHLAQDLQKLGWEITVLAPHAPGTKQKEILDGISTLRFHYFLPKRYETLCYHGGMLGNINNNPLEFLKIPFFLLAEIIAIRKTLKHGNFDLLHTHCLLPQGFTGVLATAFSPTPHITTIHGSDVFSLKKPIFLSLKKVALSRVDASTANSSASLNELHTLLPNSRNFHLIPMGATIPTPECIAYSSAIKSQFPSPLLVYVGRIVKMKGINDLLEALRLITRKNPNTHLLIAGEGQDRPHFEQKTKELKLQDNVTFTGWIRPEEIPAYMAAGDIFISPSWFEGQGLTFIEAMLAGTPVIGTNVGGIPDAVIHEKTGLLVDLHAPEQIAAAVSRYLANPQWTESIKKTARRHAESHFTRAASARAFSDLFQQLIEAKTPRQ